MSRHPGLWKMNPRIISVPCHAQSAAVDILPQGSIPACWTRGGAQSPLSLLKVSACKSPQQTCTPFKQNTAGLWQGPQPQKGLDAPGSILEMRMQEALPCASQLEDALSCLGFPQSNGACTLTCPPEEAGETGGSERDTQTTCCTAKSPSCQQNYWTSLEA